MGVFEDIFFGIQDTKQSYGFEKKIRSSLKTALLGSMSFCFMFIVAR